MRHFPLPRTGLAADACSPNYPALTNHREESENYQAIIAKLDAEWRVIECRDAIQWILQRRAGLRDGEPRWDSRCYCRTRLGLLLRVRGLVGECDAVALAILESLPEFLEGGR